MNRAIRMLMPLLFLATQGWPSPAVAEGMENMQQPRMITLPADQAPRPPDEATAKMPAPPPETAGTPFRRKKQEAGFSRIGTTPGRKAILITHARAVLDPALSEAYAAFQQGKLPQAEAAYQKALDHDPWNGDALHGMATLHLRQERPDLAEPFYQKALEADPRDARALAGLISLQGPADPVRAESRINFLLTRMPESTFLNFSRGNLLAEQGRWSEARQAYARAASRDSTNPDYLFNLAVSLDRLQQTRAAARYYQQALTESDRRPAGFDRLAAMARLKKILP